jgi:hypothetical protein
MKEIRRSAYSQSACGGPANGHGSGLTPLIRLSTGRMANALHVWSRSRFDLPGAFNCFSLSWLNGTRPFSVWPPHGVITFRTPFDIDALVGHDGGTPGVLEEFVLTPRLRQWSHSRSTYAGFAAIARYFVQVWFEWLRLGPVAHTCVWLAKVGRRRKLR